MINKIDLKINKDKFKNALDIKDGKTPILGVDYLTKKDLDQIKKEVTPVKGKDYFDGKDGKTPKEVKNISLFSGGNIAPRTPQVNSDWNATSGVAEILNKPDLSDIAKTAISTTQDNLYTNLIPNNLLIPNQWYLITDFKNKTRIPNVYSPYFYRNGLRANSLYDKDNLPIGTQLTYPDGTNITDGDSEPIYVLASSTNQIFPSGRSKVFPDEEITFKQNVNSDLGYFIMSGNGLVDPWRYLYAYGDGEGNVINDTSTFQVLSIIDENTIELGGDYIDGFSNRATNGSFYLNSYDPDTDTSAYFDDSNEGSDWSYDPITHYLTSYVGFNMNALGSNGNAEGGFNYIAPYAGILDETIFNNYELNDINYYEVLSSTQLRFSGSKADIFDMISPDDYLSFNNDSYGYYQTFTYDNKGINWTYDPVTHIFTDLSGDAHFEVMTANGFYTDYNLSYIAGSYQGQIIARKNLRYNLYVQADYRNQTYRRYKFNVSDYSAGTYTRGQSVRYYNNIYVCIAPSTTQIPVQQNYWVRIGSDDYFYANTFNFWNSYINIDNTKYCDYTMFIPNAINNDVTTDGNKLNTEILTFDLYAPVDVVFPNSSLMDSYNSTIRANRATIAGATNSKLSVDTCYISSVVATTEIKRGYGLISSYVNGNIINSIENTIAMSMSGNEIAYLSYGYFYTLSTNKILGASYIACGASFEGNYLKNLNYIWSPFNFTYNTINVLYNVQFLAGCMYNNVYSSIQNCIFEMAFTSNNTYKEWLYNWIKGYINNSVFYSQFYTNNIDGAYSLNGGVSININTSKLNSNFEANKGAGSLSILYSTFDAFNNNILSNSSYSTQFYTCVAEAGISGNTFGVNANLNINNTRFKAPVYNNIFKNLGMVRCEFGEFYNCVLGPTRVDLYDLNIKSKMSGITYNGGNFGLVEAQEFRDSTLTTTSFTQSNITGSIHDLSLNSCTFQNNIVNGDFWASAAYGTQVYNNFFMGALAVTFNYNVTYSSFIIPLSGYTFNAAVASQIWFDNGGNAFRLDVGNGSKLFMGGLGALGRNNADIIPCNGRLTMRTLGSNPQDATPANRPAGTPKEMAYYSGKMYICTNGATPTWEMITSA